MDDARAMGEGTSDLRGKGEGCSDDIEDVGSVEGPGSTCGKEAPSVRLGTVCPIVGAGNAGGRGSTIQFGSTPRTPLLQRGHVELSDSHPVMQP